MPTKDEVREFLKTHTPGKPETEELPDSFWMGWKDTTITIYLRDEGYIKINNSMITREPNQALEFGTEYLMVVAFAHKIQKFLTTP